jgi:predicted nucleic acid-binding protein
LIVYVETNFVLELAYLRSTADNCQRLIDLARIRRISLVIPAFALIEARMAWQNVVRRRNKLHSDVRLELAELARSQPLAAIGEQSQAFVAALVDTAQHDRSRLEAAIAALTEQAVVLATHAQTMSDALLVEQRYGLSPQDSLVYAAVREHLCKAGAGPKLFVTQNARDFVLPTLQDELSSSDCRLITRFDTAESIIRVEIGG